MRVHVFEMGKADALALGSDDSSACPFYLSDWHVEIPYSVGLVLRLVHHLLVHLVQLVQLEHIELVSANVCCVLSL